MSKHLHIIGSGLAGSEAAWQAAERGVKVVLHEMRPVKPTEAHHTGYSAELVCSNSFRSDDHTRNAVGLLHEEMRRCGSLIMRCADANKVPAGGALAMDRDLFARAVTEALESHPNITFVREEVTALPAADQGLCIVATGPLTSGALAESILAHTGTEYLAFFDAIAPIVAFDSIDMSKAWFQSRYDKVGPGGTGKDYINCPMTKEEYHAFIDALLAGEKMEFKEWEKNTPYFNGCLPIEVMAERGRETLAFGPMKPVGLTNPHVANREAGSASPLAGEATRLNERSEFSRSGVSDEARRAKADEGASSEADNREAPSPLAALDPLPQGERVAPAAPLEPKYDRHRAGKPYAVVQLRQDNKLGTLFNIVGFQTKLKYGEQSRIFRMIPGLENAEFARLGGIHRNTFLNSPTLLDQSLRLKSAPHLRFAGQITGVEGYIESAACGLMAGRFAAEELAGTTLNLPPRTTALGALLAHVTGDAEAATFQPMNVNFGLFPPLMGKVKKDNRPNAYCERALTDLTTWIEKAA